MHAGETCPVMGLIGAVLGLILALQKLDDPPAMAMGIGGAFTARAVGESWKDSLSIGILMNTRGLMELIVLNIG